jgi:hypothetical protein
LASQVEQVPNYVENAVPYIYQHCDRTLILAGAAFSLLYPGEPTVNTPTPGNTGPIPEQVTNTPGDADELRLYEYNGHSLKLLYKKRFNSSIDNVVFYPKGKYIGVLPRAGRSFDLSDSSEFTYNTFNLYKIDQSDKCKLNAVIVDNLATTPATNTSAIFSANGKWLVLSGATGDPAGGTASLTYAFNLYRVDNKC